MSSGDDFSAKSKATLRQVPAAGGIAIEDPGDGVITKREAQRLFLEGMARIMAEWFGRGRLDGIVAERQRIGNILRHRAAVGRRELAEHLALERDLTVEAAIAALEAAPRVKVS